MPVEGGRMKVRWIILIATLAAMAANVAFDCAGVLG
jgi:hypothetical protein